MKNERLFECIGEIDEKFIEEAASMKSGKKQDKNQKKQNKNIWKRVLISAAAVIALSIILPNTNGNLAMAMEKIPILGKYFEIVTFREYHYEDEKNQADVKVPQLTTKDNASKAEKETASTLNKSIDDYAQGFIQKFKETLATEHDGYQELSMDYQVVTDNEDWLTLKITALEVQASGYEQVKYYHIDKRTGKEAVLSDLFVDGSDYIDKISENIIEQMKENEKSDSDKVYFYQGTLRDTTGLSEDDLFSKIKPEQNFYFNEEGQLVITFNEYEVAPGYMGVVEFTIPDDVIGDILK